MSSSTIDQVRAKPPSAGRQVAPDSPGSPAVAPLVEIESVAKSFPTATGRITALDDVSLSIDANEFFTLLGPSGCGKTTLLRLLAGFEHPDRGLVRLSGKDIGGEPPNRRPVNIVFQSYALFPHMSVAKNIAFGLEHLGWPRRRVDERVAAMLALVRLEDMGARKPAQLSSGQQQRVALARALAPSPKLLLLDEPLSALDLKLRRGMQIELKRIQRETGITFVLVTHDQEEALSMSDRIAVMNEGRIEQIGAPQTIYDRPCTRFVADFFGANVLPGRLFGLDARHVAVRPERIEIGDGEGGLRGRLVETTYLGATTACVVALDSGDTIKLERHDGSDLPPNTPIRCRIAASALVALED